MKALKAVGAKVDAGVAAVGAKVDAGAATVGAKVDAGVAAVGVQINELRSELLLKLDPAEKVRQAGVAKVIKQSHQSFLTLIRNAEKCAKQLATAETKRKPAAKAELTILRQAVSRAKSSVSDSMQNFQATYPGEAELINAQRQLAIIVGVDLPASGSA
jgi:hypothetical protein